MKENISFEFIRFDNKMEANIYYRIPKILFESKVFEDLSTDAKYLYSFMLDRVSLSSKNKWIDPDGRVYIIYTVKQVCEILKCGKDKASKLLAELDSENGIGLIERVRRGLCKPDKIYVKDIVVQKDHVDKKKSDVSENATSGGRFNRLQEVEKTEVMNSEIHATQGGKNRCQEIVKTDTTNNDNIKTYNIKTDKSDQDNSNHHSIKGSAQTEDDDTYTRYEQLVKQQIEYEYAVRECQQNEVAYAGTDYGMDLYARTSIDQVRYKDGTVLTLDRTMGGIAGGGEKQDKENGVLIIRNSFPQLVDVDNLQAVHFGNIDQWLEVRE